MPTPEALFDLADFFKVLGDSTRTKILWALMEGGISVGDLAAKLEMTVSAVSHQLKTLKNARLVRAQRNGKSVTYTLDDEHVSLILDMGLKHLAEK